MSEDGPDYQPLHYWHGNTPSTEGFMTSCKFTVFFFKM